jgi:hypothetical protein
LAASTLVLRIVFSGSFLPRVAPRVHVDGDERLGRLHDDVAARGQVHAALEGVADLALQVARVEERLGVV